MRRKAVSRQLSAVGQRVLLRERSTRQLMAHGRRLPPRCLLAAHQRQDGHRRAVLLVVVVERIIPPAAVLFLQRQQDVGEVVLKVRPPLGRQLLDALRRVLVAVVIEVAGHEEVRFVRHRAACGRC